MHHGGGRHRHVGERKNGPSPPMSVGVRGKREGRVASRTETTKLWKSTDLRMRKQWQVRSGAGFVSVAGLPHPQHPQHTLCGT